MDSQNLPEQMNAQPSVSNISLMTSGIYRNINNLNNGLLETNREWTNSSTMLNNQLEGEGYVIQSHQNPIIEIINKDLDQWVMESAEWPYNSYMDPFLKELQSMTNEEIMKMLESMHLIPQTINPADIIVATNEAQSVGLQPMIIIGQGITQDNSRPMIITDFQNLSMEGQTLKRTESKSQLGDQTTQRKKKLERQYVYPRNTK